MHDAEQTAIDGKMKGEGPWEGSPVSDFLQGSRREVERGLLPSLLLKLEGRPSSVVFAQQRAEQEDGADQQDQLHGRHGHHVAAFVHEQGHDPVVGDEADRAHQNEAKDGIGAR